MEYGTIKSDVYAHNESPQEYYRYEIITRWWRVEDSTSYEWSHTIVYIGRRGEVDTLDAPFLSAFKAAYLNAASSWIMSSSNNYFEMRNLVSEQHAYIVRMCMG